MTTWFITGASSGFGRELTERLLDRGDRVAATARRPERLADLATKYGDQLWTATLDVTDTPVLRGVVDRAFAELGRIDVIVSNAGYGTFGAAEEFTDEAIETQLATNLLAPIQLTRAVMPHLRAQGGGRIVQLSSAGGQAVFTGGNLYHATKWGVEGFFEALIDEVAPFGVEITLVEPGVARTEFGPSLVVAEALEAYADTPISQNRQYIEAPGGITANGPGDPGKIADAIIASVAVSPAPRRLTLGSDAYASVHAALTTRLAELEAAEQLAHSTDF
ncbi:SDR family oxidoreductase [Streptomyces sp. SID13031]|uniref:SDR family oxidoreductase n=1 Tax=Streptomyces sp. SID13031 TaxID=2706046 RepID=UPI0013C6AD52|nr:SDR family oxidoreductase [Streptomyces sp. SID13031]NEA31632.1 SDR family oxidoreductase [Streptomyces sp. SID13031]